MVLGTMAGRCFTNQMLLDAPGEHGTQVWVPVTERAERLGVLSMTADSLDEEGRVFDEELGLLAALLVMAASPYTDRHHLQRRRQELDLAAEMQWSQNASTLSLAVFDAMGHGLPSSVISSLAVGAYRHVRRNQVPLDVRTGLLRWATTGHPSR